MTTSAAVVAPLVSRYVAFAALTKAQCLLRLPDAEDFLPLLIANILVYSPERGTFLRPTVNIDGHRRYEDKTHIGLMRARAAPIAIQVMTVCACPRGGTVGTSLYDGMR